MAFPEALRKKVEVVTGTIRDVRSLAGGDINDLYRLQADKGDFVIKTRARPPEEFFSSEAHGIEMLKNGGLDVPEVYLTNEDFLLMEYLEPGTSNMAKAGENLATMHNKEAAHYGFSQDSYLATILQYNGKASESADFFFRQRIMPLLADGKEVGLWKNLSEKTAAMLNSCPHPSLLHGDLWSGNLYHAARGPVFIDPACYWGDPLIDIAMTRLFGGFSERFYDAYFANTARREFREELISLFQIYPLLVHARLFGGGYYARASAIRDRFI